MAAASLVIVNARVRTLDPERPAATAVAVAGGTIVAVGDDHQIRAFADGDTQVVDGAGMAVVPGLVDAHQHPIDGALTHSGLDLSDVHTVPQLQEALRARPIGAAKR